MTKAQTKEEMEAAAAKAETASADAAAKAAKPEATKADKAAAAKAETEAQEARARADKGPTYGTIEITLTGSFAYAFSDEPTVFEHNDDVSLENAARAASQFIDGLEAANSAKAQKDARDLADIEADKERDERLSKFKSK